MGNAPFMQFCSPKCMSDSDLNNNNINELTRKIIFKQFFSSPIFIFIPYWTDLNSGMSFSNQTTKTSNELCFSFPLPSYLAQQWRCKMWLRCIRFFLTLFWTYYTSAGLVVIGVVKTIFDTCVVYVMYILCAKEHDPYSIFRGFSCSVCYRIFLNKRSSAKSNYYLLLRR